jgi:integrase
MCRARDSNPQAPCRVADWYESTRHTFASHYVMAGGTLEQLRDLLGHSTVTTTERYAHLVPNRSEQERARFKIDVG